MTLYVPPFAQIILFGFLGAFVHMVTMRYKVGLLDGLDHFYNDLIDNFTFKLILAQITFVAFGAAIALCLTSPTTDRQALAAGMAWTTLVEAVSPKGKRKAR